jgi:pyruvate-formate lyase-activating enzyme
MYCCSSETCFRPNCRDIESFIKNVNPAEYVVFTGGEATLEPDLLIHGIEITRSVGIKSWLISNGSWGVIRHLQNILQKE